LSNQKQYFPNNFVSSGSDDELFGVEHRDDSENEDLRGVIDDLTVENKRLKSLLKSTRSRPSPATSDAQAQDRLFDVRVHGLSVDKKRELENLLLNFATSVHAGSNAASASSATYGSAARHSHSDGSSSGNLQPGRMKHGQLPTDSGYGSNSASGMTSNNSSHGPGPAPGSKHRARNVQNYLHDIPDTLLPRHSPYMSKRAKMALVVRRLENLFTGRQASGGDHSQPLQQQEVSQSAARADDPMRMGLEGHREAHMLPQDTRINLDADDRLNPSPPEKKPKHGHEAIDRLHNEDRLASRPSSPQQRPTRPLDLDIHRAQVASENIQYLRHLGLSSPRYLQGSGKESPWIYLNLLISMAQLHSINVTPAFIKQAIRKLSTKFELSADGHKVRWTGGTEGTVFSKEEERAMELPNPSPAESHEEGGHSSKRSKTNSSSNAVISEEPSSEDKTASGMQSSNVTKQQVSTGATSVLRTDVTTKTKTTGTPFDYKPIVYKGKRYSPAVSYLESSGSSYSNSNDSSGLVQALSKSNLNQRRGSDEGMITFYQNPYFCTDLSADNAPVNWIPQRAALSWDTLGMTREYVEESALRHHDACYYVPQFAPKPWSDVDVSMDMNLAPVTSCGQEEVMPKDLPVCGIGGVHPEDNFVLEVKVSRNKMNPRHDKQPLIVPFTKSRKRKRYEYELEECRKIDLQPSKLPPPSYVFFTSSTSSTDPDTMDSDDESDESSSEALELNPPPPAFLNQWSTESDDSGDDASSVDMLEMARAADPDRVAAQEREYVINQNIGRQLEGSLAATVGASRTSSSRGGARSTMAQADAQSDVDMAASDSDSDD
jgi:hypothetical protein